LELAEPTIADGVERLVDLGHNRLIVAPVILFAAAHAKDDIPAAVAAAPAGGRDGLFWIQTDPLGLHPQLVELSRLRYDEAIAAAPPTDEPIEPAETLLILVGRGSSDAEAVADMEAFARRRTDETPVGRVMAAFVAVAEPRLDDVLRQAAAWPFRRVVVQPHLLFHGELLDGLRRRVAAAAESAPDRQWIVTAHLGPHELLIDALCERIAAADG
jgi:sirohydrochlorin ferrochelatase